jgi:hypothetical protein
MMLVERAQPAEAIDALRRAVAILDPPAPDRSSSAAGAYIHAVLAGALLEHAGPEAAREAIVEAGRQAEVAVPADHVWARTIATHRAAVALAGGRVDDAVALACRDLESLSTHPDPGDPDVASAITTCGHAWLAAGRRAEIAERLAPLADGIPCSSRNRRRCDAMHHMLAAK